jgi:glycosyltransferase involved in cell wall biosynthesis
MPLHLNNNFCDWAVVAHNDDTGFGRQANDLKTTLGIKRHLVIPSERLFDKPLQNEYEAFLTPDTSDDDLRGILKDVRGVIFFERPGWHRSLLPICRELGVKSICCPNWEWFNGNDPLWKLCDLFVCTSRFTSRIVSRYGFSNIFPIGPWPLDVSTFPTRQIVGPARHFIHNAGIVDPQDRKGTKETILAFHRVKRDDIRLTVHIQKTAALPRIHDSRIEIMIANLENPADLYREGDVAIQPSKMEGNGFMVLEPLLCGVPVITLDYPPMNEYITDPKMLVKKLPFKRRAFPTTWVKHAHLRIPSIRDLASKIKWCAENDMSALSTANRNYSAAHQDPQRQHLLWSKIIAKAADSSSGNFFA